MKKFFSLLVSMVFVSGSSFAQEQDANPGYHPGSFYSLNWSLSIPVGDFNEFVSVTSPAGGSVSGRFFILEKLAVGFEIGWNNYYEKFPRQTYYFEDGTAITAAHYRYAYMVPFKCSAEYFFTPVKVLCPYLGLSMGGNYMEEHVILQNWDFYETQWGFILSPEAGALIRFGTFSKWGFDIKAAYWFNTNSFSIAGKEFSIMQGVNVSFGICYLVRGK